MKQQPVSEPQFWKDRLDRAKANSHLHWSVYLCGRPAWDEMEVAHREILKKEIEPGAKVLDAGCGYGRMARYFDPHDYTGIDISPDLLAVANAAHPKHRFLLGSLKQLPFRDAEFDVAFCVSIKGMVVGNLGSAEWEKMESEIRRVADKVLLLEYGDVSDFRNYVIL